MSNIRLICHRPGFRRLGIAHEASKVWPADRWTDEQLTIFDNDRQFEVLTGGDVKIEPDDAVVPIEVEIGSLDADDQRRLDAIDEVIFNLVAADYGTEGQPLIGTVVDALGFVPMPEEIVASEKRLDPDATPGDWGSTLRADAIAAAVHKFKEDDFTKEGIPKIPALQKAIGFKPTPDEIKVATPK
ncbi:MAG: hypothetical protein COB78_05725 [Hyphomicrobiales bacterium]|nr:MAG: hypothetical protein COB78_05725 [Hyphomicrobiales bacterium]